MLFVIFKLSNIISNCLFCQFTWIYVKITSINKLSLIVKFSFIDILNLVLFPFHSSLNFTSFIVCSCKLISIFYIHLLSVAIKNIVFKLTIVHESLRYVRAISKHIVIKFSLCVCPIFKDENTLTICFSVRK